MLEDLDNSLCVRSASSIEDLVLYRGRRDYGTRVLSNTGNLAAVMKTMGHRDLKTAMKYRHPELEIPRACYMGAFVSTRTIGRRLVTLAMS